MENLIFLLLFISGYWLGNWQNRHYRRDRLLAGQRMLQLRTQNQIKAAMSRRKK